MYVKYTSVCIPQRDMHHTLSGMVRSIIRVCLDGTITDSRTLLVTMYYSVVMLGYDWWLCMVINISVQYNGGLLPDIILLTQGYYQWGTRLNTM